MKCSEALDKFGDIHGLLIDLRGNPGGLLNEAVNMSDKFLQKGQIVVSQHGRAFCGPGLPRQPHGSGAEVSHRRAGEPQHSFGRGDRFRRAAGP